MTSQEQDNVSVNLVETLRGIILFLDPRGRITLCNPYFESLTGYSSNEVLGRDWFDTFIPEPERETIRAFFAVVMREGLNDGYTNAILIRSGEQRLIEWHSKTVEDDAGAIVGMLCTGYDVTEREAATDALAAAKQEAERSTAAKSRFLAAASHDLRQPLQSLGLYLSVMMRQIDQPGLRDVGDKMRKSLDAMGELLDALLDISKLDAGSVTANKRDMRIQELFERIVNDNVQQARAKGLRFECTAQDHIVHSDPVLLERVIANFVSNAIRYTEHGHVTIDCDVRDGIARIAVRDSGIGIPKEALSKVFEEYYQLDNDVRDRRKGLGLGLSIVKHISRLLDHALDVDSVPGTGSTFAVEIPLGTADVAVDTTGSPTTVEARDRKEPVILFVDDDPAIVDATKMLLDSAGIQVYSALNGDDALAHIESGLRPDLLVSDYRLPGYTGVELIRRVRNATTEDLPSVLMTGDTAAAEIQAADLDNCTVLHKPVDTEQLISLIESTPT